MTEPTFDSGRAEAFADELTGWLNGGAAALMASIGHRTGLFDVMAGLPPSDSEAIARHAGLAERYVREWLGAMVTSGVVEYDGDAGTYHLPPEHAASLTRAARPANMAVTLQWLPLLGSVEDEVVACFEQGGGVPYASYERFHPVMAEESDQTVVAALIDHIVPLVPGLPARLAEGIDVLDVGCGSGRALTELARAFPQSRFLGVDFSEEAIAQATRESVGMDNLRFEVRDATALGDVEQFDLVTAFDAIHDQIDPAAVLQGVAKALRPDGVFLMQEIRGSSDVGVDRENPMAPFLYTISCMHCMTVSLSAGGAGLGAMWGQGLATQMLGEAGFVEVDVRELDHDPINLYFVARRS